MENKDTTQKQLWWEDSFRVPDVRWDAWRKNSAAS